MKIRATFDIELPDALASALLRKSGVVLVEKGDQMAALTLMALRPIPGVLREFLLAPDRKPMRTGTPARLTTEASETSIDLTLTETTECTPSPRKSASSSKPRSTPSQLAEQRAEQRAELLEALRYLRRMANKDDIDHQYIDGLIARATESKS